MNLSLLLKLLRKLPPSKVVATLRDLLPEVKDELAELGEDALLALAARNGVTLPPLEAAAAVNNAIIILETVVTDDEAAKALANLFALVLARWPGAAAAVAKAAPPAARARKR